MYRNKFIPFLFLFTFSLFAKENTISDYHSKQVKNLSLDFTRTESFSQNDYDYATTIKGHIIYSQNPFIFTFETQDPETQKTILTSEGSYYQENDSFFDFPEGSVFLEQTCLDFLNWFKSDFGLTESGYFQQEISFQDNQLKTSWNYSKPDFQPIRTVITTNDSTGKIKHIQMFLADSSLITDTKIQEFSYSSGYEYPTKILTTTNENGIELYTTELTFSNVTFTPSDDFPDFIKQDYKNFSIKKDRSVPFHYASPEIPKQPVFRTSTISIITNQAFGFYKRYITNQDATNCPFYPSCSQYMMQAISQNNLFGIIQGLERLKRCTSTEHKRDLYPVVNNKHYDPLPAKTTKKE